MLYFFVYEMGGKCFVVVGCCEIDFFVLYVFVYFFGDEVDCVGYVSSVLWMLWCVLVFFIGCCDCFFWSFWWWWLRIWRF